MLRSYETLPYVCLLACVISFTLDVHPGRKGIPLIPRSASTIASHELRGRPVSSITAVSAGGSPPFSKWIPFSVEAIQRVLSPRPWFKCNGKCPLPTEGDTNCAHVVSNKSCTLIRLTVCYRYLWPPAKITRELLTIIVMERSQRYATLTAKEDHD